MGTRAAFFVGDFRDVNSREWLGCVAWDGYPDGLPEMCEAKTEEEFRAAIAEYSTRDDFASPDGPFPYPWNDDLCLTDCVYTWHGDQIWFEFDRRFVPLSRFLEVEDCEDGAEKLADEYPVRDCLNIPAPGKPYDGSAPDSIMIVKARSA